MKLTIRCNECGREISHFDGSYNPISGIAIYIPLCKCAIKQLDELEAEIAYLKTKQKVTTQPKGTTKCSNTLKTCT